MLLSIYVIALVHTCLYTPAVAAPFPLSIFERLSFGKRDVTTQSNKWQKNCQKTNLVELEEQAWNDMQELANAAKLWKPGGAYQPVADMYFGENSQNYYNRIMSMCPRFLSPYT
jgi:hypothetical protein